MPPAVDCTGMVFRAMPKTFLLPWRGLAGGLIVLSLAAAASGQSCHLDAPGQFVGIGAGFGLNSIAPVPNVQGGQMGVVVGAYQDDLGLPAYSGAAYLFSAATGELLHSFASPMPVGYGGFGICVAGIGDVDGDGHGDVLIGAYGERRAYVFSGASGALVRILTSGAPAGISYFGYSLGAVDDLNHDGTPDIIVGASGEASGAGRVYVFSGATGAELRRIGSPNPAA